jgi:RNA polymerase sigma factor (sigma-70 family)
MSRITGAEAIDNELALEQASDQPTGSVTQKFPAFHRAIGQFVHEFAEVTVLNSDDTPHYQPDHQLETVDLMRERAAAEKPVSRPGKLPVAKDTLTLRRVPEPTRRLDDDEIVIPELEKIDPQNWQEFIAEYQAKYAAAKKSYKLARPRDTAIRLLVKHYKKDRRVRIPVARLANNKRNTAPTNDTLGLYLQDIGKYDILTPEEEIELFTKLEDDYKTFTETIGQETLLPEQEDSLIDLALTHQKIYYANLKLVPFVAGRMKRAGAIPEDMPMLHAITGGNSGIETAILKFEVKKGFKFSTYATWWVRQAIQRTVANESRIIKAPIGLDEEYHDVMTDIDLLRGQLQRQPTEQEIFALTGKTASDIYNLQITIDGKLVSLDKPASAEGDDTLGNYFARDDSQESTIKHIEDSDLAQRLLSSLNETEQVIVSLRQGIYSEALRGKIVEVFDSRFYYDEIMDEVRRVTDKGLSLGNISILLHKGVRKIRQAEESALKNLAGSAQFLSVADL